MTMAVSDNVTHELLIKLCEKLDSNWKITDKQSDQLTLATLDHNKRLQDELDRTKKQLEIAVDALKDFSIHPDNSVKKYAKKALEQITAEQKIAK
jgi:hypothetical protein